MEQEFIVSHISKSQSQSNKLVYSAVLQSAKIVNINMIQANPLSQTQPKQMVLPAKIELSSLDPFEFDVNDIVIVKFGKKSS